MVLSPATYEHTQRQTHTRARKLTHMPCRHCHRCHGLRRSRPSPVIAEGATLVVALVATLVEDEAAKARVYTLLSCVSTRNLSIYLFQTVCVSPPTALENAARHDTRHAGARRRRRRHRPLVAGVSYRPDGVSSPASCCTRTTPCRRATTALELRRHCDAAALTKGAAAEAAAKAAATLAGRWNGRLAAVLLRSMCEQS